MMLESDRCLLTNGEWPERDFVNVVNHNSEYDIMIAVTPKLVARYNPNPSLQYHEYQSAMSSYSNCLPKTVNNKLYCGGMELYSRGVDGSTNNEYSIEIKNPVQGVLFQGYEDGLFYIQQGLTRQVKINLDQCFSTNFDLLYFARRTKCLVSNCNSCDIITGNTCVTCAPGYFLVGGACLETCGTRYYYQNKCLEHCPRYMFKYRDSAAKTYCVSSCDQSQGLYPFGDTCDKCKTGEKKIEGGKCRCKDGKINREGVRCDDSCPCGGFLYKPYDDMCIPAIRDNQQAFQITGNNLFCVKSVEYYNPLMKSCLNSCSPPQLKADNHPQFGKACIDQAAGCQAIDMVSVQGTNICVSPTACPSGLLGDTLTHQCEKTCSSSQAKDLVNKICVSICPLDFFKDPDSLICVSNCPSDKYKAPSSRLCVPSCPSKVDKNKMCYEEFEIVANENSLVKEVSSTGAINYSILLSISITDRSHQMIIDKTPISALSNNESIFLKKEEFTTDNFVGVSQFEWKLVIKEQQIADKCPLTIFFDKSQALKNQKNELFYTKTEKIVAECNITAQTDTPSPIQVERSILTGSAQLIGCSVSVATLLNGVALVTPNANFLTFIAQTYNKLIFLTLLSTKMTEEIEYGYLNIFRDLFDDISIDLIKDLKEELVETNMNLVCEKQSEKLCKTLPSIT